MRKSGIRRRRALSHERQQAEIIAKVMLVNQLLHHLMAGMPDAQTTKILELWTEIKKELQG
jgi:hypothetical protein